MKSKKGGKSKGKKGGGGKKKGKKPPKAGEKTGFELPADEMGVIPGFGSMVTKQWEDAYHKGHTPLMIEIARTNMQQYWEKVTDAQSKASLLYILGYSLIKTLEGEARKEGEKYVMEGRELIRSIGERSVDDILFGVWPESLSRWMGHFYKTVGSIGTDCRVGMDAADGQPDSEDD
jgi:hypothetical protein